MTRLGIITNDVRKGLGDLGSLACEGFKRHYFIFMDFYAYVDGWKDGKIDR